MVKLMKQVKQLYDPVSILARSRGREGLVLLTVLQNGIMNPYKYI